MEMGGWMASVKEAGGHISSRNSGGTIFRLNGPVARLGSQLYSKRGSRRRGGVRWYSPLERGGKGVLLMWEGGESGCRLVIKFRYLARRRSYREVGGWCFLLVEGRGG